MLRKAAKPLPRLLHLNPKSTIENPKSMHHPHPYLYAGLINYKVKFRDYNFSPDKIQRAVCSAFDVTPDQLHSRSRTLEVSIARHTFCYLMNKYTNSSLSKIGLYYMRNHVTARHSIIEAESLLSQRHSPFCNLIRKAESQLFTN